jgi:hypothetical protein
VTYPELPEWSGPPWTFSWFPAGAGSTATELLLDDLHALPAGQWLTTRFDTFLEEPDAEIDRLCTLLELNRDHPIEGPPPVSASTLSPPAPGKWQRDTAAMASMWPILSDAADRAARTAGLPRQPITARR